MKYILLVLITLVLLGCETSFNIAKGKQYCHDKNTTFYSYVNLRSGVRIKCTNGLIKEMTPHEFNSIIGPIVEESLKANK